MAPPNIKEDAVRVFEVLKSGGIAIIQLSVGYAILSSNPRKLEEIFLQKGRAAVKRHAVGGTYQLHKEVHVVEDPRHAEIVRSIVEDFDLPLGVIAKYNRDHRIFKHLDDATLEAASVDGTMSLLLNAGKLHNEIGNLALEAGIPCLGSSANLTGTGKLTRHLDGLKSKLTDFTRYQICTGGRTARVARHGRYCT